MEEDDRKVSAEVVAEVVTSAEMHNDTSDNEDDGDHESDRSKGPLRKRKYAPSPPKRFKSSYICFSMAMHEKLKAEMGGNHNKSKISEVSKYMAEKWRNLDEEERAKWDEVARKDRERYEAELALFPGPMPKPKQRPKKDPSAPKRPMSAFLAFSQKYRVTVRQNDPTVHNRDVSRKLSEMWKELPEKEKKKYIEQESKEREVYKAKMAEWKKEQAEVKERMKKERKANKKRRRVEKKKEKREAEKQTRRNEEEMLMQLRAAEAEYYVDRAKESGDPSELRKISGMGFLAAAAEAASKVGGSPTSTNEPTSESAAVDAGAAPNNPSSNDGHEHLGVAAVAAANNQAPAATTDQVMSTRNGLAAESLHGSSGSVEGYSMEGEVQRALAAAGTTQAIPTTLQAQHHHTSPAAALLRAYSRPGAPAVGGSAIPDAPIAAAADPVSQLASSALLHPHISPSALSVHLGAHATQGQEGSLGAVVSHAHAGTAPQSFPPSNQQYLQQLFAEEDFVREQLARVRAQEAAALAQMRARIQERTRMRLEAERERILLSLRAQSGLSGVPGVLTGLHGSVDYPSSAATYLDPGLSTSRAAYSSGVTQGLEALPSQAIHGETLTGNMLLELMEARRRDAALAALALEGRVADAAGGAPQVAPQDLSVQPTQHILPTGAIPLEVPSTSLTPAGAVQAPPAAPLQAVAPQDPSAAPPPAEVVTQAPAVEETPTQKTS